MVERSKKHLVVGLGKTGTETCRFLMRRDVPLKAIDSKGADEMSPEVNELVMQGLDVENGPHSTEQFEWADTVILSPGVSFNTPVIKEFINSDKEIISEIEFSSRLIEKPVIGITGSNGKTTTSTLLADVMKENGFSVFLGGNIGTPLVTIADSYHQYDYIILELSSFQLQGTKEFKPHIATILNISQNHLDHHADFDEYLRSKLMIFSNQDENDWAVYNRENKTFGASVDRTRTRKITLGTNKESDIYRSGSKIHTDSYTYDMSGIKLLGEHNLENIMTVIAIAHITGCEPEITARTINSFEPLPHRTELLRIYKGAKIYNDSKSTTPDSTLRALRSIDTPVILILGGRDKGLNYSVLQDQIKNRVRHLVLYGEAKNVLKQQLCCGVQTTIADTLEEATKKAASVLNEGDTILFSPACSSFDMFSSYIERGKEFKRIVELL